MNAQHKPREIWIFNRTNHFVPTEVPIKKQRIARTEFIQWTSNAERRILDRLTTPAKLQVFLDSLTYSSEKIYRCPLRVLRDRSGHCYDGAVFAAAGLEGMGLPPLIVELLPNHRDDDHIVAVYRQEGCWGAIAHSNFSGLRYREPVFRTLRELVMSYFEQFYNVEGEKTLRGHTLPLNLAVFDSHKWMTQDKTMQEIAKRLDKIPRRRLLSRKMIRALARVDARSYQAGLAGAVQAGLYSPRNTKS